MRSFTNVPYQVLTLSTLYHCHSVSDTVSGVRFSGSARRFLRPRNFLEISLVLPHKNIVLRNTASAFRPEHS